MNRRGLLGSLVTALAAPAIIRTPGLLMAIKPPIEMVPLRYLGLPQLKREGEPIYWMDADGFYTFDVGYDITRTVFT